MSFLRNTTALPSIARFRSTEAMRMHSYLSLFVQSLRLKPNTRENTGPSLSDMLAMLSFARAPRRFVSSSAASFLTGAPLPFYPARTQSLSSDFAIWRWLNPVPVFSCRG